MAIETEQFPALAVEPGRHGMTRVQQTVVIIAAVLAIAAIGLAAFAVGSDPSTGPLQAQITALKQTKRTQAAQIAGLQTDVTALKATTSSLATTQNMNTLTTEVAGVRGQLGSVKGQLRVCLPQLSQEINTLTVSSDNGSVLLNNGSTDTFLTDAYLSNPTVVSSNCTRFLAGPAGGTR